MLLETELGFALTCNIVLLTAEPPDMRSLEIKDSGLIVAGGVFMTLRSFRVT